MRDREAFLTLIEELRGDYAEIQRLAGLNRRAWDRIEGGSEDVLDYGALAYTIHTLYGEDLDPAQTAAVQAALFRLLDGFPGIHEAYCEKLRALAEAV